MRSLLLALVMAVAILGCGSSVPSTAPTIVPSADAGQSAAPVDDSATPAAPPAVTDQQIADAMASRQLFGLRADEAWVRGVATNPTAKVSLLDFPMLPQEEAEYQAWTSASLRVGQAVQQYAEANPKDFSGVYIDQPGRRVVALFNANLEAHRAAIAALLPDDSGVLDVRLARLSNAELQALIERIVEERDWLKTIDAAFVAGGVDEQRNRVDLEISSANPAAPALIAAHYGVGPDVINVTSDGTGIKLLPRGTVNGRILRADGSLPGDNDWSLDWTSDRPGPGAGDCGNDIGYGVDPDGQFTIPCAPGGWTIHVQESTGNGMRTIGSGHVVVPPGLPVNVVITVKP